MKRVAKSLGLLGCAVFLLAGCGSDKIQGVIPVTGVVTADGKPVQGATVSFVPDDDKARSASGLTESDGTFKLTTVHPGDGAMPGKYKITVNKASPAVYEPPASQEEAMAKIAEKIRQGGERAVYGPSSTPKEELPTRYGDPKTSGLMGSVEEGGDNHFKLELKEK